MTKLATNPRRDTLQDTIKASGWKNLIFDKDGNSYLCNPIYPTENAARAEAEDCMAQLRDLLTRRPGCLYEATTHDGRLLLACDISHVLQLPWSTR